MKNDVGRESDALRQRIKELEDALAAERRLRERYQTIFEKCPIPLTLIDAETHRFTGINESACRLYQREAHELVGVDPVGMSPATVDGRPTSEVFAEKSRALREQGRAAFDWDFAPTGSVLALHIQQRLTEIDGKPTIISVSTDVTARKQAERLLARQTRLLEQIEEMARVGAFEVEVAKGELFWTKQLYKIMAAPEGYVPNLNHQYVAESSLGLIRSLMYRCITTGEGFDCDADILDRNGRKLRARYMGRAVVEDGRTVRIVCVIQDIDERMRIEDELLHMQKMESIGTLAGGVAHDFSNVLMGIVAEATLLRRNLKAGSPEAKRAEGILETTKRGAALTKQLLMYARKEATNLVPAALDDVVKRASAMLQRLVGEEHLLTLRLEDAGVVRIDRYQIEQVLMNMVTNSRDAMPQGGAVTISTRRVGDLAELAVEDTGHGIAEADLPRVFDPFFTTKPKGRGTGLGLSICYGIVKQNAGSVRVESQVGKGTVFRITLPIIRDVVEREGGSGTGSVAASSLDASQQGLRILLAEDDEKIRDGLRMLLEAQGYQVVTAVHGGDAKEIVRTRTEDFAAVVTDVVMPYLSGLDFAQSFREEFPDVPIIFMTGYTDRYAELPVADWERKTFRIDKPFDPEELLLLLGKLLAPLT